MWWGRFNFLSEVELQSRGVKREEMLVYYSDEGSMEEEELLLDDFFAKVRSLRLYCCCD